MRQPYGNAQCSQGTTTLRNRNKNTAGQPIISVISGRPTVVRVVTATHKVLRGMHRLTAGHSIQVLALWPDVPVRWRHRRWSRPRQHGYQVLWQYGLLI